MATRIEVTKEMLENPDGSFCNGGVEINIAGYKRNPACPDDGQIWLEMYEDKLQVHVWNGDQNPTTITFEKEKN